MIMERCVCYEQKEYYVLECVIPPLFVAGLLYL